MDRILYSFSAGCNDRRLYRLTRHAAIKSRFALPKPLQFDPRLRNRDAPNFDDGWAIALVQATEDKVPFAFSHVLRDAPSFERSFVLWFSFGKSAR